MQKVDFDGPFIQLTMKSIVATVGLIFFFVVGVDIVVPGLGRPLSLPLCIAIFCGTLGFQVEIACKHYVVALLQIVAAIALFPLSAWLLLIVLHVSYQTREADFIAVIPQALLGTGFFHFIRRRFERPSYHL